MAFVSTLGGAIPFSGISSGNYVVRISGQQMFCVAGSLKVDLSIGRRSQASFTLYTDNRTHFQQYQTCTIFDQDGNLVFSGYLSQIKEQKPGKQPSLIHTITASDQHFLADKRIIAKSYTGQTCGTIVQDIVKNYLAEEGVTLVSIFDGLIPDATLHPSITLYPSGNVGVIPSVVFSYCTIAAALDALVTEASSAGIPYYWMIDQNKKLYFVPYTSVINNTTIDGSFIDQLNNPPAVQRQNPKYRNIEYLTGGVAQTLQQVESHIGDGNTTTWTLGYALYGMPTITVQTQGQGNAVLQNVGIKGSAGSQYYWAQGDPIITQDNNLPALASNQTIYFSYIGQYSSVVVSQNNSQISAQKALDGTSGKIEVVDEDKSLVDIQSALIEVSRIITRYGIPGTLLQFNTMINSGFAPGQLIQVNLPDYAINSQQMLIETVSISDSDGLNIWYTINAVIGPYDTGWVSFFSQLLANQQPATAISVGTTTTTPPVVTVVPSIVGNFVSFLVTPKATLTATAGTAGTNTIASFVAGFATPHASLTSTPTAGGSGTTASFTAKFAAPTAALTGTATASSGGGTKVYPTFSGPTSGCPSNIVKYQTTSDQAIRFIKFGDNTNSSANATNKYIYGTNILLYWANVETSENNYDWSKLEADIKPWSDAGKKCIVRFSTCGQKGWAPTLNSYQGTPSWVLSAAGSNSSYTNTGGDVVPAYWNTTWLSKFQAFITAFGQKYDGDSRIEFIQAAMGMGGECKCDTRKGPITSTDPTGLNSVYKLLQGIGYTDDIWFNTIKTMMGYYMSAFTKTPLAVQTAAHFFTSAHREQDIVAFAVGTGKYGLQNDGIGGGGTTPYTSPNTAWKAAKFISAEQRNPTSTTGANFECDVEAIISFCQNSKPIYAECFESDLIKAGNDAVLQKYGSIN